MKTNLIIIILIFVSIRVQAQQITGIVVSTNDSESLAYVNIGVIGTTYGTVSGLDGAFELFLPETISKNDSIRFSSIGFAGQSMTIGEAISKSPMRIALQPINLNLPEVIVRPSFTNYETIGNKNISASRVTNLAIRNRPNQNLGSEVGRKFKTKKPAYLEKFRFYIAQNNFDTVRFRINIYNLKNGKPMENILNENIIIELNNRQKGWIEVDLSNYQIQVNDHFAASAEWVYASSKGNQLNFPITIPSIGATHFYKYGSQNAWKKFSQMSAAMEVTLAW